MPLIHGRNTQVRMLRVFFATILLATGGSLNAAQAQVESGWMPEVLQHTLQGGAEPQATPDFGEGGERALQGSPWFLPNYTYAGYRWGEQSLPRPTGTVVDASDYGVKPNDQEDDTRALNRALDQAHAVNGPVVVQLPSGRLHLREILFVERGNLVLQGKGHGEGGTTLVVEQPMRDMDVPPAYESKLENGKSQFAWKGGVIWIRTKGSQHEVNQHEVNQHETRTAVVGRRGHHVLYLRGRASLRPGEVVKLQWYNSEVHTSRGNSLLHHVYCSSNLQFGRQLFSSSRPLVSQSLTVVSVDGSRITVKEPLLHDIRPDWKVRVSPANTLEEIGLADLRISFPDVSYAGHFQEPGYNGVFFNDAAHGWIKDVTIENADTPIILDQSTRNITLQGVDLRGRGGHHGILVGGEGILVKDFSVHANFIHTLTSGNSSRRNVFTNGYAWMGKLDQHAGANHQNLYDDIKIKYQRAFPSPLFRRGGSTEWEPAAAAFNTFWNVRVGFETHGSGKTLIGKVESGPHARIVGLHTTDERELAIQYSPDPYVEGLNRPGIAVPSLYEYQLNQRLRRNEVSEVAILRPALEAQISLDRPTIVEAVIRVGANRPDRVVFYADGKEIGTDAFPEDGWTVEWTPTEGGTHLLHAVLIDRNGKRHRSELESCTRQDRVVWVGDEPGQLNSNYPNPFREESIIRYAIRQSALVRIELFDVQGRMVRVIEEDVKRAGEHTARINGSKLSSGVYFYRITAGDYTGIGKSVVIH